MYDYFDKHGKKFLAVLGSILILAFIMPAGMGRGMGGGGRQFGKLDGKPVDASEVEAARANFEAANRLTVPGRPTMQGMPGQPQSLVQAVFPEQYFGRAVQNFQQNPVLWYLLVREAAQNGMPDNEAAVDQILSAPVVTLNDPSGQAPIKDVNPAVRETYRPAIRQLLAVQGYFERRRSMVKPTAPMIDDALAKQTQQVRVRLATYSAADFTKDIPAPNDEQFRAQFETFAAEAAGVGTSGNPFGFGYKIADKLQLQWVAVPRVEAQRVVEASKSPELWEEDAIMYYHQNSRDFQTQPKDAKTQPTSRPYAEAKTDVLTKVRDPQIDQLQHKIAARIAQQMTFDAQRARAAGPTTQQASGFTTGYGVPYGSFEYLQKLAADIEKQFGVKIQTTNSGMPLSKVVLQAIGGIGESQLDDLSTAEELGEFSGPGYLFDLCKPLLAGDAPNKPGEYDLLSPSKILKSPNALYVARALSAEPSHAPHTMDEVRPAVEKDVREKLAFAKAAEAAQKLVSAATAAGSFEKVAGAPAVQTSDWFGAENSEIAGVKGIDNAFDLITPIFDQLRGVKSLAELPRRTVIKRQAKGTVIAAEVFDARTTLSTAAAAESRRAALSKTLEELVAPSDEYPRGKTEAAFVSDWFSLDGVSRRLGFVQEGNPAKPGPGAPPAGNNPANPFVPG